MDGAWKGPSGGLKINAPIKQYTVATGETIEKGDVVAMDGANVSIALRKLFEAPTFNSEVELESANASTMRTFKVTENRAIFIWYESVNTYAMLVDIDDAGAPTHLTPVLVDTYASWQEVAQLTATKYLVVYSDGNNSSRGTAVVVEVDGDTINVGTPSVFHTSGSSYIVATGISDTEAIIAFRGVSTYPHGHIATVSGLSVSFGTQLRIQNSTGYPAGIVKASSDRAILSYEYAGQGRAVVLYKSGGGLQAGVDYTYEAPGFKYGSEFLHEGCYLEDNKVALAYLTDAYGCNYRIATVSGTTLTFGTAYGFGIGEGIQIVKMDSEKLAAMYWKNDSECRLVELTVSGTTISTGINNQVFSSSSRFCGLVYFGNGNALVGGIKSNDNDIRAKSIFGTKLADGVAKSGGIATETIDVYDWR